jgi:hypothetical protein
VVLWVVGRGAAELKNVVNQPFVLLWLRGCTWDIKRVL